VFDSDRAGRTAAFKAVELAASHQIRTRVATIPAPSKDPDEFLRAAGAEAAQRWEELVATSPSGWEAWIRDSLSGLNTGNPNHLEVAATRAREVLDRIPDAAVRETYRERAAGWIGVQPHLLSVSPRSVPASLTPTPLSPKGRGERFVTPSRYLVQLLAVRPVAFERVQAIAPDDLDESERGIFVRMLGSYQRGGPAGLEAEMAGYPPEEQDLIRRAWAAPPPNIDDEVAVELAERIRLERMKGMYSGIIRELSEAERGRDSDRVGRLETQAGELARAISDLERRS
jgi:hypothetical protein